MVSHLMEQSSRTNCFRMSIPEPEHSTETAEDACVLLEYKPRKWTAGVVCD